MGAKAIKAFVADLPSPVRVQDVWRELRRQKFTGAVTFNLLHGQPKSIDVPEDPRRIALDSEAPPLQT